MSEARVRCKHFNSGYCKYLDKCKFLHPKEECENKCQQKNCMKRHVKLCRYGTNCRHKEKCSYKHKEKNNTYINTEEIVSLRKTLKELLDYKSKSEAKIKKLEEELKTVNLKKPKEKLFDTSLVSKTDKLGKDFEKLKSEFELLKMCQRTQATKAIETKVHDTSLKDIKCSICNKPFQTRSGLKVHTDIEHPPLQNNEAEIKCNQCGISCSDLVVLNKHNLREHKFKCEQCHETFKEEGKLKSHTAQAHK